MLSKTQDQADDIAVSSKLGDVEMVVIKSFDEAPTFI